MTYTIFNGFKATQPLHELTQSLLGELQAAIDYFGLAAPSIADQPSPKDVDARAAAVRSDIDVFLLRAKQGTQRLEKLAGDTGLLGHLEATRVTLHGEITRLQVEARSLF